VNVALPRFEKSLERIERRRGNVRASVSQFFDSVDEHAGVPHFRKRGGCVAKGAIFAPIERVAQFASHETQHGPHAFESLPNVVNRFVCRGTETTQVPKSFVQLPSDDPTDVLLE
jgi:hypothetical protein